MTANESFSVHDLLLLKEALQRAAARHESMSRFNPRAARPHDTKSRDMRMLIHRINLLVARLVTPEHVDGCRAGEGFRCTCRELFRDKHLKPLIERIERGEEV